MRKKASKRKKERQTAKKIVPLGTPFVDRFQVFWSSVTVLFQSRPKEMLGLFGSVPKMREYGEGKEKTVGGRSGLYFTNLVIVFI